MYDIHIIIIYNKNVLGTFNMTSYKLHKSNIYSIILMFLQFFKYYTI